MASASYVRLRVRPGIWRNESRRYSASGRGGIPLGPSAPSDQGRPARIMGHMSFFRSRTMLVSVSVLTIVALSVSMAVMFI